jgi:hypothetical protein
VSGYLFIFYGFSEDCQEGGIHSIECKILYSRIKRAFSTI